MINANAKKYINKMHLFRATVSLVTFEMSFYLPDSIFFRKKLK